MTATREPQQDRSRATRLRLLDAAVESLVDRGWAHSTVAEVAERAGVSRGAAQHHFPTREALITAAVEHMTLRRGRTIAATTDELATLARGPLRTGRALDIIVGWFIGDPFRAALELWVAAAADPQLRTLVLPLERNIGRLAHQAAVDLLGADEDEPGVREMIQATLDLARGLGLSSLLSDDEARRKRILRQWAVALERAISD